MQAREIKKLYYSISEVGEITGLKQYVLRYWETEFPNLKPNKNKAGNRIYKSNDLDLILEIKNLLYKRKFTIKGAKQFLSDNSKHSNSNDKIIKLSKTEDIQILRDIKTGLDDLINLLKDFKD